MLVFIFCCAVCLCSINANRKSKLHEIHVNKGTTETSNTHKQKKKLTYIRLTINFVRTMKQVLFPFRHFSTKSTEYLSRFSQPKWKFKSMRKCAARRFTLYDPCFFFFSFFFFSPLAGVFVWCWARIDFLYKTMWNVTSSGFCRWKHVVVLMPENALW